MNNFISNWLAWGIISAVIIIALILVLPSFYALNSVLSNISIQSLTNQTKKISGETNQKTPPSAINTSDWINYTDNSHGFTLKYPNGWQANDHTTNSQTTITISTKKTINANPSFQIIITQNALEPTVKNEVSEYNQMRNYQQSSINFAGKNATQITYTLVDATEEIWAKKEIILTKNGLTYILSGTTSDPQKNNDIDLGIFDTIAATFQFK